MNPTRAAQEKIFRDLYKEHRGSPMAVSSESLAHKTLRFEQVSRIFEGDTDFTIHDVGMGLADYLAFLNTNLAHLHAQYSGSEILPEFVDEARKRFPRHTFHLRDLAEQPGADFYDYVVMSGVFHQRRDSSIGDWEAFAQSLIAHSFQMCRKAVGFNFISPFVDFYQPHVYYCNIHKLLHFINDSLSRFFVINHNYALFELTVFVFRDEYIESAYPQPEFVKYFKRRRQ